VTGADFGLFIRLTAHSVVQGPDGQWYDMTPLNNEYYRAGMRFIHHVGDERVFFAMKELNIYIDCLLSTLGC
jgi:hypothetical protein